MESIPRSSKFSLYAILASSRALFPKRICVAHSFCGFSRKDGAGFRQPLFHAPTYNGLKHEQLNSSHGHRNRRRRFFRFLSSAPAVIYRVFKDSVEIVNVIHGAQKWSPKDRDRNEREVALALAKCARGIRVASDQVVGLLWMGLRMRLMVLGEVAPRKDRSG